MDTLDHSERIMSLAELAQPLAQARRAQTQIDPALLDAVDTEADAYKLQALAIDSYDSPMIGYKVGATNEVSQKLFGCDGPFFGPLFESDSYDSGVTLPYHAGIIGGEAEFAFVIDRDIPADKAIDAAQITDYIRSVHIAVELVGRRTTGEGLPSLYSAIADFGGNAAFIRGPIVTNWQSIDLSTIQVSAQTNGEETNSGSGAAVLGHPINSLLWLHESLRSQGKALLANQWITTGTCLGVIQPTPDAKVDITFERCGEVSYQL